MKKFIVAIILMFAFPLFTACEISNTDLANSLEGNMTRLVYSVGYLDRISTEELSGLVNNSTYFTHSSLYNNSTEQPGDTINPISSETLSTTNDNSISTLNGGLATTLNSGRLGLQSSNYRSSTYSSNLSSPANPVSLSGTGTETYSVGRVDLSLLETNADDLNQILLDISTKRGIIMLYCTDLRSGRATLSIQDKEAISEYNDLLAEATNYLNSNTGTLTNYFNGITSISTQENSGELINAKLIRANEVLKTRYAKLDTCLDSLNAIINIMVNSIGYDYSNLYTTPNTLAETPAVIETPQTTTETNPTTLTQQNNITTPATEVIQSQNGGCCPSCPNTATAIPCQPIQNNTVCTQNGSTTNQSNCCDCINKNTNLISTTSSGTCTNCNGATTNSFVAPNNSTIDAPVTLELTDKDYGIESSENTLATEEAPLTKSEIALNGGLVKGENIEKITSNNANTVIANACFAPTPPADRELNLDNKFARELNLANPLSKKDKNPITSNPENISTLPNTSQIKDFSDNEYYESEKELSPELLPFTSTTPSPNTLEAKPLSRPELGAIGGLPIEFENDNCLKPIPLQ